MENKDNFFKNSLILTLSNSTMGILRFIFSVILSRDLGAEGMGLYGLIMPIYDLFCCLVCGGLTTAISKETAVFYDKKEYKNLKNSVQICFSFDLFWSILVAVGVFVLSPVLSRGIIKDPRTLYSLQVICPALVFVALSSIIKGYFYGVSKVNVPAIIDILEKAVRISAVVLIIKIFVLREVTKTVTAVYIALSVGEFISFIFLYIFYKIYSSKMNYSCEKVERRSQLLFDILIIAVPLCINGFLSSILNTASTLIVPRRLVAAGFSYKDSLSMIGKFSGMAMSITFFPAVVIASMSTVLVPDISQSLSRKDYYSLQKRIEDVIRISFLLGMATLAVCLSIPNPLGMMFYNRTDLGSYIVFSALCAPTLFIAATTYSILSGLGKQNAILVNSMVTSVEEVILLFILTGIPSINVYGLGISFILVNITSIILNMRDILSKCYIHFEITEIIIHTLICIFVFMLLSILNTVLPNNLIAIKSIAIIIIGFTVFFMLSHIINKAKEI